MNDATIDRAAFDGATKVSVVIPARNEGNFIATTLEHVLDQDHPAENLEVCVVDGMSEDATIEQARATAERLGRDFLHWTGDGVCPPLFGGVKVVPNPRRITPVAFNTGITNTAGEVVIIIGGHSMVQPDYVSRSLVVLSETGADGVGGWCETVGGDDAADAMASAQSSVIGVGNAYYRTVGSERRVVDTVPFPAYRRETFARFGMFDEALLRNQDDEFNFRIRQGGGSVVFDPTIRSKYVVRPSLSKLFSQYRQYGYFRIVVMRKRKALAAGRHLAPMGFVGAVAGALALTLATRRLRYLLLVLGPYLLGTGGEAIRLSKGRPRRAVTVLGAFFALHWGYGLGQWQAIMKRPAKT